MFSQKKQQSQRNYHIMAKGDRIVAEGGDASLRSTPDCPPAPHSALQEHSAADTSVTQGCVTSYPVKFLNKKEHIAIHRSKLPHWHQNGKVQFITFRLADSLPKIKIDEWTALRNDWLKRHPEPHNETDNSEYTNLFGEKFNQWLDAGYGKCSLSVPAIRNIVTDALFHYNNVCYKIHAFVIMPNHVHILLSPICDINLTDIIGRIKGYTANKINKTLNTNGGFWQRSIFDRIVRNHNDFIKILNYIKGNPSKLNKGNYTLYVQSDI